MDDIRTVVKELRRIADAGERISKALEKQNQIRNIIPKIIEVAGSEEDVSSGEDLISGKNET